MKILLAVDDSKYSQAAIESVLQRVHPPDTEVRVLHVLEPILEARWSSQHVYAEMMAQRRQEATEMVKRAAESLKAVGFKMCSYALESGIPKAVIIEEAKKWGADLIVVGSHGRTGLDRFLLGSVSEAVARHATCSVEIVRAA
ncbi:MAG: universal stress protein [Candidatus Acidiferrales bacterium]